MKLKWLGHASFLLTAKDGTTILTDPYEPGGFSGAILYDAYKDPVDIVTISHDHNDHGYTKELVGNPNIIKWSGAHNAKGINIKGVTTYHDNSRGRERGNNIIFVITVDSIKICHCGDLGHVISPADTSLIGPIDVLLIPVGGHFTIDAKDATAVAERLDPKLVIPMHYKTDKCKFPIATVDPFLKGKTGVKRMRESEIEINAGTLPRETEIVVLQHAL